MSLHTVENAYEKVWTENAFSSFLVIVDMGDETLRRFLTDCMASRVQAAQVFINLAHRVIEERRGERNTTIGYSTRGYRQ